MFILSLPWRISNFVFYSGKRTIPMLVVLLLFLRVRQSADFATDVKISSPKRCRTTVRKGSCGALQVSAVDLTS